MNKLEQLRKEAERLTDSGDWVHSSSSTDFLSECHMSSGFETNPTVFHFTHQPCMDSEFHERRSLPLRERTVACVMPNGPDNVIYHRAGECPRIDYDVDTYWWDPE